MTRTTRQMRAKVQYPTISKPQYSGMPKSPKTPKSTQANISSHPSGEAIFRTPRAPKKKSIYPDLPTPGTGNLADTEHDDPRLQHRYSAKKVAFSSRRVDPRLDEFPTLRSTSPSPSISNVSVVGSTRYTNRTSIGSGHWADFPTSPRLESKPWQSGTKLEARKLGTQRKVLKEAVVEIKKVLDTVGRKLDGVERELQLL